MCNKMIPPRKISRYHTPVEATSNRNPPEKNKPHKASHVIAANKKSDEGAYREKNPENIKIN